MPFGAELFGGLLRGKPNLPSFTQIDPLAEQQKAISGNQAALPGAESLVSGANQFNSQQIEQMLATAIPGFANMRGGITSNISDMLSGKLPGDVSARVQDSAAAKSFGMGTPGGGIGRDLVARDLGLTSLDLTQKGISSAQSWIGTMGALESPGMMNVSSMFLTPGQVSAQDTSERNAKFQHDWTQAQIDWQTSPGYLAGNDVQSTMNSTQSMLMSYFGGSLGGGGGGGASLGGGGDGGNDYGGELSAGGGGGKSGGGM